MFRERGGMRKGRLQIQRERNDKRNEWTDTRNHGEKKTETE
jgi:hypothetical protein